MSNDEGFSNNNNIDFSIRLLSGGISSSDKNNEWDKILLESSIDKSLWNLDQPSWVSTTLSSTHANRVLRGQDGYFTSLKSGTANTSTGFRPVLLVEFLNKPPVFNLTVDKEFIHREDVIVSGDVSDENLDEIRFRFILNNEVVEDWSEFELSPVHINYTINSSLFEFGDNLLRVEIEDSFGNLVRWNKTIKFTNINPDAVLEVDKLSTFETDVNIVGQIIDPDNDGVSYRLKVNDQVLVDWTAYTSPTQ